MKWRGVFMVLAGMFVLALVVSSCKPSVPSTFIPEDEMEDILYDYHLADAMARLSPDDYDNNVLAYRAAVLKKYGVTEAEFDTSMVYYMRHTQRLHGIYKHLAERMEKKAQETGSSAGSFAGMGGGASGDTVDIWKGPKNIALIPNQPYNVSSFSLTADTAFHKGDSFILMTNSDFVFQDGMRDGIVYMALVFKNDSVASRVLHISSSTQQSITLADNDSLGVKEVKGYFMLNMNDQANASGSTLHLMTLSRIRLFRCHRRNRPALRKQSADSLKREHVPPVGVPVSDSQSDSVEKRE